MLSELVRTSAGCYLIYLARLCSEREKTTKSCAARANSAIHALTGLGSVGINRSSFCYVQPFDGLYKHSVFIGSDIFRSKFGT